jgi:hypothetical protein
MLLVVMPCLAYSVSDTLTAPTSTATLGPTRNTTVTSRTTYIVCVNQSTPADDLAWKIGAGLMCLPLVGAMVMICAFDLLLEHVLITVLLVFMSMLLGLVALSLPWALLHWWRRSNRHDLATTKIDVDQHGIQVHGLGHIPWARLSSIDQVNNDDGVPIRVQLKALDHHMLSLSPPAGETSDAVCAELLSTIIPLWNGSKQAAEKGSADAVYRFVPFRFWKYMTPIWLAYLLGALLAIALLVTSTDLFKTLVVVPLIVVMMVWLVAGGHVSSWHMAMPRRARAFRFVDHEFRTEDGEFAIDLRRGDMTMHRREGLFHDIAYMEATLTNGRRIDLVPFGIDVADFDQTQRRRHRAASSR